ncbi:MAG: hypothetical protein ACAI44_10185, partial [Candidatus Sericytochromatia bacterium]
DKAEAAYDQALKAHGDLEIKCRFALFLQSRGQDERARALLAEVLASGERLPNHARKLNRIWLDLARKHHQTVNS